ncbi:MAG: hypothetical protein K6G31_05345 [Paludibacteraceae bacterium]|nr:hypothetical protein [Paludibacteraceae bacterium]
MKNIGKYIFLFVATALLGCSKESDNMGVGPTKFVFNNNTNHFIEILIDEADLSMAILPYSSACYVNNDGGQYPFVFDGTKVVFDDSLSFAMDYDEEMMVDDYDLNLLHRGAYEFSRRSDTLYKTFVFTEDYYDYVCGLQGKF